jgi:diadenylate cyclase
MRVSVLAFKPGYLRHDMLNQLLVWRSILDVVMITGVLYFLYRTLIRLGTWKIVYGIIIAAVIFIISNYLDLRGIEWIYRNVSHVAVISLVVIFQPELRKIFERTATMRRNKTVRYDEEFSRIIAESMWEMASRHIGAIIVIPGNEPITAWLNGGYAINATPTYPLVMSLFDPHSPGHDGALIVKQGQLASFGVRLPVSTSGRLSEAYGTRHQAAMGLSERSDAMVIVASEERGTVSVFEQGEIKTMTSETMIMSTLCSHCGLGGGRSELDRPPIHAGRKITMEVLGTFAVALVFWITMIYSQSEILERIITVPVVYTATQDEVVMIGEKPKDIKVHLSGSKSDLDSLSTSSLSVKIDLARSVAGKQTFPITEDNIQLPKGIRLIDVEPPNIEITMAKLVRKEVSIEPQFVGSLPNGLEIQSITTVPDKVEAFLPSGESGEASRTLTTTPVYLNNIQKDTTLFCKVVAPPTVQPVEKSWPDVTVLIKIKAPEPVLPAELIPPKGTN